MTAYPNSIYVPRERANWPKVVYNAAKKTSWFKEDADAIENEIIAIEKQLFGPYFFDDFLRGYSQIATNTSTDVNSFVWRGQNIFLIVLRAEAGGVLALSSMPGSAASRSLLLDHNDRYSWQVAKKFCLEWRVRIENILPLVSQAKYEIGVGKSLPIGSDFKNIGMFFRHKGSSPNWLAVTKTLAGETETDTGISIDSATLYNLRILVNQTNEIEFYVDNVLVATHSDNILQELMQPFAYIKPEVTSSDPLTFCCDYFKIFQNR